MAASCIGKQNLLCDLIGSLQDGLSAVGTKVFDVH